MIKKGQYRNTAQFLLPERTVHTAPGRYDIYPAHDIGEGRIFKGAALLAARIAGEKVVAVDGFEGVFWDIIETSLAEALAAEGRKVSIVRMADFMKSEEELRAMLAPYLNGDDPVFGRMTDLHLSDWFRSMPEIVEADGLTLIIGPGAALAAPDACLVYADLPKNELQFRMRAGSAACLGFSEAWDTKQMYKQSFFCSWQVLNLHKAEILGRIDWFVDSQFMDEMTFISGDDLRSGMAAMAGSWIRVRPWFEPGVWGGHFMQENFDGLNKNVDNLAWSFELMSYENGLLLESGGLLIEFSFDMLMSAHAPEILGRSHARFGTDFPIRFDFLDTIGGGNLSVQCHPRPEYIRREFNMPFTQDETYYILACEEGSTVYLGFQEGIDPARFEEALNESQRKAETIDIEKFVQRHPSKKHDLFLIPNGTIHGSGSGNMVLEISSAPYIFTFKMYDWMRMDLSGKPRPINIRRGMDNLYFDRQGEKVQRDLICHPREIEGEAGVRTEHLPTHPRHFYDVFRYTFDGTAHFDTDGQADVWMIVEGSSAILDDGHGTRQRFNYAETFIIPACCGAYTLTSEDGRSVMAVRSRVKDCMEEGYDGPGKTTETHTL